jgi:hypothetical protein
VATLLFLSSCRAHCCGHPQGQVGCHKGFPLAAIIMMKLNYDNYENFQTYMFLSYLINEPEYFWMHRNFSFFSWPISVEKAKPCISLDTYT